jgi:hypothetical protein
MAKKDDEPDAPSDPAMVEVEITVAGHTIRVNAPRAMEDVAAQALGLYEQTKLSAKNIPIGFDAMGAQIERVEQPDHTQRSVEPWGPEEE